MSRSKICRAIADCSATQCSVLPAAVLRRLSVLRGTSTIMAENQQKNVPSELIINEKWDTCLERTVINFGIGLVSAGVAGVVLTRAPGMRRAVMGFGAGCGVGSSWVVCSQDFAKK